MKKIADWFIGLKIYYQLLPYLILYLIIVLFSSKEVLVGDEERYLIFSQNLLHGFYSPQFPNIKLWAGPGYPLFLTPFVFFNPPLLVLRLLNGILLYFSLVISYKTFTIYSSKKKSLFYTMVLGLYYPVYESLSLIHSESLTWFLISLICFLFIKNFLTKAISLRLISLAAMSIAFLAITKIIFGYVILVMLLISLALIFLTKFHTSAKKSFYIFLLSFVFCFPWLIYTYSLTNTFFYWGGSGSMSLYTMASPYKNELGDWSTHEDLQLNPNHKVFMDSILQLKPLDREKAYKSAAIQNIKNHPKKYFTNWLANIGRLFFSYPNSNTAQTINSYYTIIPNMFIIVFILFALVICIVKFKSVPEAILLLTLFIIIYLFGSTLVSAFRRMFYVTMPFWFVFINFVFSNLLSISIKKRNN